MKFTECYLDKIIENDDGINFQVIDVDKIEFDDDIGRKKLLLKLLKQKAEKKSLPIANKAK